MKSNEEIAVSCLQKFSSYEEDVARFIEALNAKDSHYEDEIKRLRTALESVGSDACCHNPSGHYEGCLIREALK